MPLVTGGVATLHSRPRPIFGDRAYRFATVVQPPKQCPPARAKSPPWSAVAQHWGDGVRIAAKRTVKKKRENFETAAVKIPPPLLRLATPTSPQRQKDRNETIWIRVSRLAGLFADLNKWTKTIPQAFGESHDSHARNLWKRLVGRFRLVR